MRNNTIDFYYFSGTGNTLLIAKEMARFFDQNQCPTNLIRIEKANPKTLNPNHIIGLAFPVACQSTYPFIWKFIEALPNTEQNTDVFVVDTLGLYSGGVVGPLKKILKKKGYHPIGAKEIKMPSNFGAKENKKPEIKIQKGIAQAKRFAHDIVFEFSTWKDIPFLSTMLNKVSRSEKVWNKVRITYSLELIEEKCIKCGDCYQLCPVYNIDIEEYPTFFDHCQLCMRCYVFCPTDAIQFENKKMKKYSIATCAEILARE